MKKLLVVLLWLFAACAQAQDRLHLYNWNNYLGETTAKRFEAVCRCQLVQSYYGDNEEMLAKLAAGAKGYDLLVPTGNALQALIRQGALQPLDKKRLSNLKNINIQMMDTSFDKGNRYSVPYAYTITLIGYNEQKIEELGISVDSWAAIFDPVILSKIKGKVTVLDSATELMAAAMKYLGYSMNDTDVHKWQEARDVILKAKPYWAAFNGSSYIKALTVGDIWLVHGYSNDIFQADEDAKAAGRPFRIRHALPKEGASLSIDSLVIPKDAPRPDLAHQFINFMLEGENGAELANLVGSGSPNVASVPFIYPSIAKNQAIFPDAATSERLEMLQDLTIRQRRALHRIWTEIRAR